MNKDARIYVAGHRGLVGSAILRRLKASGYENIVTRSHSELDLTDQSAVEAFFRDERPDYVFLCAAKVGGILANNTYKAEFIYQNLMIAANCIHAAYKFGVKKLLNLGSSCIYPKHCPQPMKERYLLTGPLEPTNEPYAIAKISAIKLCRYYNEQHGTDFISTMPTNLYGPNDNFNLETAHVLPALMRKFHLAKLLREGNLEWIVQDIRRFPLGFGIDKKISRNTDDIIGLLSKLGIGPDGVTIWGSGNPFREFLHVDDLADASVFLMEWVGPGKLGEFVNVGTGKDLKIRELAEMVKAVVGFEGEISFDASRPDGTPKKLLDVSRIHSLGWRAKISLDEGIRSTYRWYRSETR